MLSSKPSAASLMPETPVPANAAEGVKKIWKNENLSLSCPFLEVNHAEYLLPGLLDGMVVVLHLLREKLLKPFILVYVLIDEPDGLLTVDLDSRLTRLAIVEPCLGPTPTTFPLFSVARRASFLQLMSIPLWNCVLLWSIGSRRLPKGEVTSMNSSRFKGRE